MEQIINRLGRFGEALLPLRKQIADAIAGVESLEQLFPLRALLKECTETIHAQQKELLEHGDSLEKAEVKKLAEEQGYSSWQQYKKQLSILIDQVVGSTNDNQLSIDCNIQNIRQTIKESQWLTEKFGDGQYTDVLGLCKAATRAEIEGKTWSLTPGAYVGVAPVVDGDEENFAERLAEIHNKLLSLQAEANILMDTITANFEGLGL